MNINFNVEYFKVDKFDKSPMIIIKTSSTDKEFSFSYSNIYGMYKTESTQGHGIHVNNRDLEHPILKMCEEIAQAVYNFQKEIS